MLSPPSPDHHGTLDDLRTNIVVEYKEHAKEVNEIVRDLPDGLGWGTFIWEATSHRWGGLFDREGKATKKIDIYTEFFSTFEKDETPKDGASAITLI